ncbi:DUF6531 domain-containing protein [Streptomyces gossypii]|uniref:DUF6531 domain-containing protein n=1 Tax=Streptomyces gossypii TaxID=2883101 RepID=UPI002882FF1B|nr:DUF6531 domain-containing protein [Streptomyces gossypii]
MGAFEEAKEWLIESFGMWWPDADEDKCREAATAWREFATTIDEVRRATDGKASALIRNNDGEAIDAFTVFWHRYYHQEAGWLQDLEDAVRAMAKGLDEFADEIDRVKSEINTVIAVEAVVIVAGITATWLTLGAASGPAAAAAAAVGEAALAIGGTLAAAAARIATTALLGAAFGGVESVVFNLAVAQPMRISAGLQDGYNPGSTAQASRDGMLYGGIFGGAMAPFLKGPHFDGVRIPPGVRMRPNGAEIPAWARPPKGVKADLDPIDVATGEMLLPQTDVELPGALPLVFERTHLSSYRIGGWFGSSWASTVDERVQLDSEGAVFAAADGMRLVYPVPVPGQPALPVCGPRWPLLWDGSPDGVLTVTNPEDGTTRTFATPTPVDDSGVLDLPLACIEDRNGARIDIDRSDEGAPLAIRHSGGYHLAVETTGPRITALRLLEEPPSAYTPPSSSSPPSSGTLLVRYAYNEAGHLSEVTNSSGRPLRFTYDAEGRITSWKDRNDASYAYSYDTRGRVVRTEGSGGFLSGTLEYDEKRQRVTVTNSLGQRRLYRHDAAFQIIEETDELGHTTHTTWDATGTRPLSVTDPLGHCVEHTYDEAGNLTAVTLPDGSRASAAYNALGLPLEVTEPGGARWQHTWDERGNLLATTDPVGAETRYTYDPLGHPATVTDPLGRPRHITCNAAGLPTAVTDELGHTTTVSRDRLGRITALADATGATTRMGWTPEGKPAWRELPDGARESWTWDAEGSLLTHTDPMGNTTRHSYGPFDVPVTRTEPDGTDFAFAYDAELRLTAVTNPQGLRWTYAYDAAGHLASETDFNDRTLTYTHDGAGRLTSRTNGAGETLRYTHDALGRIRTATADSGDETTFTHDTSGHLTRATNPDHTLTWEHDALGRVLAETTDDRTTRYTRDAVGRVTRRTTPGGAVSIWTWDPAGRPAQLATDGGSLDFTHDAVGREVSRRLGPDVVFSQSWDANSRLRTQSLTRESGAAGAGLLQHRTYTYRPDSLLTEISELASGTRRFDLDPQGRITSVTAHGWTETYAYDSTGNLTRAQSTGGADDADDREHTGTLLHRSGRTHYTYDGQGRLLQASRKLLNGQTRTQHYTWNAHDQLTHATTPDGEQWHYTYDPLGRRVTKRLVSEDGGDAPDLLFTWDGTRLAEQTTLTGDVTTWDYTPGTHTPLTQTTRHAPLASGAASPLARLAATTATADAPVLYAVLTDHTGTPTELVTPDGDTVWQHRTTLWGTPLPNPAIPAPNSVDCPLRFPGQYADPETGLNYNYFRYYDPHTARYLTPDPLGLDPAPNPHTYVPNPHTQTDPLGLAPYIHTSVNRC